MATAEEYLANPIWVKKMRDHFNFMDKNKNGFLTQEELTSRADKLKKITGVKDEEEAKLREALVKLAVKLGATGPEVQIDQDGYVKAAAEFASKKEESTAILNEVNEAFFNCVDTNDDGTISVEEYGKVLQASNMKPEGAKVIFDLIDKNHNGKIEMKELVAISNAFYFSFDPVNFENA